MQNNVATYVEYVLFAPVLDAVAAALDQSDWDETDWECYGEQIGEIGTERAIAGSPTARNDAERIWRYQRVCNSLRSYAHVAPMHADACDMVIHTWVL